MPLRSPLLSRKYFAIVKKNQDASLGNMVASVLRLLLASPAGDRKSEVAV